MNVSEMMTREVRTCSPDDSLNSVAQLMWQHDCGCVPVVDSDGKAIGMITDRDICMAAYTQGQPLGDMLVASAASHGIMTMHENESVDAAEVLMQKHQIRRIPVVRSFHKLTFVRSKLTPEEEAFSQAEETKGRRPLEPLLPGERVLTRGVVELTAALDEALSTRKAKTD